MALRIHNTKFYQNLLIHDVSKIRGAFLTTGPEMGKSGVKVEKCTLVTAEKKSDLMHNLRFQFQPCH